MICNIAGDDCDEVVYFPTSASHWMGEKDISGGGETA